LNCIINGKRFALRRRGMNKSLYKQVEELKREQSKDLLNGACDNNRNDAIDQVLAFIAKREMMMNEEIGRLERPPESAEPNDDLDDEFIPVWSETDSAYNNALSDVQTIISKHLGRIR